MFSLQRLKLILVIWISQLSFASNVKSKSGSGAFLITNCPATVTKKCQTDAPSIQGSIPSLIFRHSESYAVLMQQELSDHFSTAIILEQAPKLSLLFCLSIIVQIFTHERLKLYPSCKKQDDHQMTKEEERKTNQHSKFRTSLSSRSSSNFCCPNMIDLK